MKKFQTLENLEEKVPTIGSFSLKSSNHWNFLRGLLFGAGMMMTGTSPAAGPSPGVS